ncbi:MAG: glycosyltransferase family 2 protein [Nitrospirae bacterium]|nr:glycosyltransferase family 2 protein [Nitrospirota bacterium]
MYKGRLIAVIIPAFNEEDNIGGVIDSIPSFVDRAVVIDDCSRDRTSEFASSAGAVVIRHDFNMGVGAAFNTGLEHVLKEGFDIMVNIDGDGQFSALDIPRLIDPIVDGNADFVTASRFIDSGFTPDMPKIKSWGNRRMSELISRLSGKRFHDVSCGFRAYSRDALMKLNLFGSFTYTQESFLDLTFKKARIKEVPVRVKYFGGRESRVASSIPNYILQTLKIIFRTYRDYRPLRFFWSIAFILTLLSLSFGSILLFHYFSTGRFSGQIWSGFVGAFFFVNAVAFFITGVIADILYRMRVNQERMMYRLKKMELSGKSHDPHNTGD